MIRNLWKRKGFALINLLGLATGMAICLLLALYIESELGYDNYQERGDQIYRLALERKYPNRTTRWGDIPPSIGQAVKMEFPEVLESTRVSELGYSGVKINISEKMFTEKGVFVADSNFFRVFTGEFLQGDINTALQKPGTAVLSEGTAKRYFGSIENAMGQQIVVNETWKYIVSGICRDWPYKSHFQFNVLVSTSGMDQFNSRNYIDAGLFTYLLLNKKTSAKSLELKLPLVVEKYVAGTIEQIYGKTYKQFRAEGNAIRYFLQPLKKIHLISDLEEELRPVGSIRALVLLATVAGFILFLACINFINLSTALSVERAGEIGIRKTLGSGKAELIWQFLAESVLFSLASMIVAMGLALLLVPMLNNIAGSGLTFTYFLHPLRLLMVIGFSILVGIIAGLYPAFVLSSFDPILVLKGRFKSNRRGIVLRNALVIFQFAISVILIISTIVVNKQMQYMLADQFNSKQDHIITIDGLWQFSNRQSFIDEISRIPGVGDISKCTDLPFNGEGSFGAGWAANVNKDFRTQKTIKVDDGYFKLLDLQLIAGRIFSSEFATDSFAVILNETSVRDFGLKNPIGTRLISKESDYNPRDGKGQNDFTVIGVVKDFHYQSLRRKIEPVIFVNSNKFGWGAAGIRIKGNHFKSTIVEIEKRLKKFDAKDDFQFGFLDQTLASLYKVEQTQQKIFMIFSVLAILIACVGLFGLAAYSTQLRTKEISIRKVLGAMPANIIVILSQDFLTLVLIASLVAFPLAWLAMYKWLQNFAYRIDISWWVFLLAGSLAAMIALLTISYHTIKVALANPLKSLKTE